MKKKNIYIFITFLIFSLIYQGCKNETMHVENKNEEITNDTNNKFINDSMLNFSDNPQNIKISTTGRTIKTNELKTDIQKNLSYYAGIYGADTLDVNTNGIPDWEQIIINYDYNKLNVYLRFYEIGGLKEEYIFSNPVISNGILNGYIIENNKKEITEGKFVYFPDESLPNGKLTGLVLNRKGRLVFFASLYSNGIQNLF